jgi:phosphatidylserine synthase
MKKYTLDEIRLTQKGKGFYLKISNEVASYLIYFMQSLSIHPNYFTLISLFFGFGFSVFLLNSYIFMAALMINLFYLFDNLDGQWARIKKMTSPFGALFDSLVDGWNISIVIATIGIYCYWENDDVIYLYLTILFFILSFLEFALEKNMLFEESKQELETISLHKKNTKLKGFILWISSVTSYDKWILFLTLGTVFERLDLVLIYVVFVRALNYATKLLKLYMQYR